MGGDGVVGTGTSFGLQELWVMMMLPCMTYEILPLMENLIVN